jgi:hypothetical protein
MMIFHVAVLPVVVVMGILEASRRPGDREESAVCQVALSARDLSPRLTPAFLTHRGDIRGRPTLAMQPS